MIMRRRGFLLIYFVEEGLESTWGKIAVAASTVTGEVESYNSEDKRININEWIPEYEDALEKAVEFKDNVVFYDYYSRAAADDDLEFDD